MIFSYLSNILRLKCKKKYDFYPLYFYMDTKLQLLNEGLA